MAPSSSPSLPAAHAGGLAFAGLVVGAMAMGISPVFVRNAEVGPLASAFWRVALSLPFLWLWVRVAGGAERTPLAAQIATPSALLAGLFFSGDLVFWHLAIVNTSIANATFFACLAPIWVTLLSRLTLGEAVARGVFVGLAVCLAGAALLIFQSVTDGEGHAGHVVGDLFGLATSFFFGLYFLAVRAARRRMNAAEITLVATLVTTLLLFMIVLVAGEALLPRTMRGVLSLAALGTISHAGGQGLLSVALGVLSAAFSSLVIFIEAVAAAAFGWVFAGEALGPAQLAGGGLILLGLFLARPARAPQP